MLPAVFLLSIFSVATANCKSMTAVLLTRFFGGIFGSAPISNVSAALGDFYSPRTRGIAMTFYGVCVIGGPTLSPTVGAAVASNSRLGWRCMATPFNSRTVIKAVDTYV